MVCRAVYRGRERLADRVSSGSEGFSHGLADATRRSRDECDLPHESIFEMTRFNGRIVFGSLSQSELCESRRRCHVAWRHLAGSCTKRSGQIQHCDHDKKGRITVFAKRDAVKHHTLNPRRSRLGLCGDSASPWLSTELESPRVAIFALAMDLHKALPDPAHPPAIVLPSRARIYFNNLY